MKGAILPMSTHTAPIDVSLTPEQALLTDQIGNEVYASHYAERKAYRLIIGCGTLLLCGSMWLNFSLAHRPIANRYIRIDEMGRAQAIQYTDLNYSPREGEVRTYLTEWANYRYTINRDTIAKKFCATATFARKPAAMTRWRSLLASSEASPYNMFIPRMSRA
jgi:type IV secretion system protein VirB5